ncbi:MAG: lactonase family protein [Saprospiraceae bacterium]|nr:lactonase family protein [Saprospiraceae bacterium]
MNKTVSFYFLINLLIVSSMTAQGPKMIISSNAQESAHGLYVFDYHSSDGSLLLIHKTEVVTNSSYHNMHPKKSWLYSVANDQVRAFVFDPNDGSLSLINIESTVNKGPCYVYVDKSGQFVLVANYGGGGIASFKIENDGSLSSAISAIKHEGSSVDEKRQQAAHPHLIMTSPENKFALVPDLGMDQVVIYRLDGKSGELNKHGSCTVAPGAGPRHLEFHPNNKYLYLLNELNSTVGAYQWSEEKGELQEIETYSALPEGFSDFSKAADIHLTSNGKYLYASNRGHNSLAAFKVHSDGTLEFIDHYDVKGDWPRNFFITPDDRFLFVANRRSDSVVQFAIDADTGVLSYKKTTHGIPGALCIKMVE